MLRRIHRDNLVVEVGESPLILRDQLRIERPGPVARDRQGHLRRARQNRLLRMAVAAIDAAFNPLTIQVLVEFGIQAEGYGRQGLLLAMPPLNRFASSL